MRGDEHAGSVTGFVLATFAFFVAMVGTTLPTPLYPLFEQRYSFGSLLVTVIFAIYAFGVIAGLILFGNLSDRLGRKPLLALGLVLSAVSALLFLFAGSLLPIYAGRIVSGLSAGTFTGTATAYIIHLAPDGRHRLASFVAVFANLGGLGAGTLLSGLLAEWAPHALRTPFAVDLVLVTVATAGPAVRPGDRRAQRVQLPAVAARRTAGGDGRLRPRRSRGLQRVRRLRCLRLDRARVPRSGSSSPQSRLAGLLVFVLFVFSVGGQALVGRLPNALAAGCAFLVAGVAVLAVSLATDSLAALFASAVVGGLGQGVVVSAGLAAIAERAPAERPGETASSFFAVLYLGLSLPVIAAGVAIHYTSLRSAGIGFCAGTGVLTLGVLASQIRSAD